MMKAFEFESCVRQMSIISCLVRFVFHTKKEPTAREIDLHSKNSETTAKLHLTYCNGISFTQYKYINILTYFKNFKYINHILFCFGEN